jgi:hypothetical protein
VTAGRLPDFLVAGFPKAGTTSLAAWLADHPTVYIPVRKEVDFFNVYWDLGVAWYAQQFHGARDGDIIGDASVRYSVHPERHQEIAALLPAARVVILVREPVSRAISHYWYLRDALRRVLPPIDDLVEQEMELPSDVPGTGTLAWGRYSYYLDRLGDAVGRDRIRVWTLDDLRARPQQVFDEVCGFIGVEPASLPSVGSTHNWAFRHRSQRIFHLMLRYQLFRRLPFRLGVRLDELNRVRVHHPPTDARTRECLAEFYAPWNRALTAWIDTLPDGWHT